MYHVVLDGDGERRTIQHRGYFHFEAGWSVTALAVYDVDVGTGGKKGVELGETGASNRGHRQKVDDAAEPLASEGAAENPSGQVAPMGNDLFDMAVEQPRNDDVDADHGVTGSSHE